MPVPAVNPHERGAILLLYDVTDLVRLDEMRSELVAVASHELQTPLTTLRMTLLMLKEAADVLPERHRELVATSLIGVEQLTETVHEFLDLTRIEAGELRLNLEPVHVGLVIAEALRRVEAQARAQDVTVAARVDPDLPQIWGDPLRLRAVFDNVLSNAFKYTPAGGAVTIDAHRLTSGAVSVSVCDTGPGIPTAFRSRVFEKFFRLEHQSEAHPAARGAGIGLYMCRQIVELHGGEIACCAGDGNRGTCITVTVPATSAATIAAGESASYVGR